MSNESTALQVDCTVEKFSLYLNTLIWMVIHTELWKYRAAAALEVAGLPVPCSRAGRCRWAWGWDGLCSVSSFPTVKASGLCPRFAFFLEVRGVLAGKLNAVIVSVSQIISQMGCIVLFVFVLFVCSHVVKLFRWVNTSLPCTHRLLTLIQIVLNLHTSTYSDGWLTPAKPMQVYMFENFFFNTWLNVISSQLGDSMTMQAWLCVCPTQCQL